MGISRVRRRFVVKEMKLLGTRNLNGIIIVGYVNGGWVLHMCHLLTLRLTFDRSTPPSYRDLVCLEDRQLVPSREKMNDLYYIGLCLCIILIGD